MMGLKQNGLGYESFDTNSASCFRNGNKPFVFSHAGIGNLVALCRRNRPWRQQNLFL
jgi:hypothetical protein